jgi:hypothetical protein
MKKLPLGIQTFSKVINGNYIYVDKTQVIYKLIQGNCVFFARPRRFGKSLLCSTLEDLFLGKKELFKGLWIDQNTSYDWPVHPVVHIDMSTIPHGNSDELIKGLWRYLAAEAKIHTIEIAPAAAPGEILRDLVIGLFAKSGGMGVVLIIDEYDKPIISNLHDSVKADDMRNALKSFYEVIKGLDRFLRFVFLTGVSRFSKTSIFSGLNQVVDITMDPRYAYLVGYTEDEITTYCDEYVRLAAENKHKSAEELIDEMREWYDGYRFWYDLPPLLRKRYGQEPAKLYTPFSILKFFDTMMFGNFWFESGTPAFLLELLKQNKYSSVSLDQLRASAEELSSFEPSKITLTTLLFQTGYVSIKSYDDESKNFLLGIPNREVSESLYNRILGALTAYQQNQINDYVKEFRQSIERHDIDFFVKRLKQFFVEIPYNIALEQEKYYQSIVYMTLRLVNMSVDVVRATNVGRIDMVVETVHRIYIFEFKLNKSARVALEQIKGKKYFERYLSSGKLITLVGMNFSSKDKNIDEWVVEDLNQGSK